MTNLEILKNKLKGAGIEFLRELDMIDSILLENPVEGSPSVELYYDGEIIASTLIEGTRYIWELDINRIDEVIEALKGKTF